MSVDHHCRSWVEVDLAALERNLGRIRATLPGRLRYVAVVKADAYGHGIHPVATRLMQAGADLFAVANAEEARALRELGAGWPILLLSPALPGEGEQILEDKLTPSLSSEGELSEWETLAGKWRRVLDIHLKVDTGMARAGVWHREAPALMQRIEKSRHLRLAGIFTHFACAESDPVFTALQRKRFAAVLKHLPTAARPELLVHADNSAGLETFQNDSPYNAIRVGLLQFGILPYPDSLLSRVRVEPVLSFHTRVGLVKSVPAGTGVSYGHQFRTRRRSRLAILTAGYGDGIPLSISNRAHVLIRGVPCPVRGRVCMDQTIVDITALDKVAPGEIATLFGRQNCKEITLSEFASRAGTIPYEILTSVTRRVTRIYKASRE